MEMVPTDKKSLEGGMIPTDKQNLNTAHPSHRLTRFSTSSCGEWGEDRQSWERAAFRPMISKGMVF